MEILSEDEVEELLELSDEEILPVLKRCWEIPDNAPIVIRGWLRGLKDSDFSYIHDPKFLWGEAVKQPIPGNPILRRIFVAPGLDPEIQTNSFKGHGQLIKCEVKLGNSKERAKQKNPFVLAAIKSTISPIERIDNMDLDLITDDDGTILIEKSIVTSIINNKERAINEKMQLLETEYKNTENLITQTEDQLFQKDNLLIQKDTQLFQKEEKLEKLTAKIATAKEDYMKASDKYKLFIGKKSNSLLALGLISQEQYDELMGNYIHPEHKDKIFVDFKNDLESDFDKATKYIQSYLFNKDIYYKRDLITDFLVMLKTNDLIILAGDSGSGKTNLVKSVAEAIGGVSVIVPVKPNWTGSEDLLGYYNPLEKKYLSTPFLDALIEAGKNPNVYYLICLDEMNLARVEYYFADFLSLLEERSRQLDIYLYSDTEASQTLSECMIFLELIDEVTKNRDKMDLLSFIEILKDEKLNKALHEIGGFRDGASLLKYHSNLRRLLTSMINTPSSIVFPDNVRIIGAINVDETTHYLSPKILDRAHVIRFNSPLLYDWEKIENEIEEFDNVDAPIKFTMGDLGSRTPYPKFDRNDEFARIIIEISKNYMDKLGVDFGLRTVRQALNYSLEFSDFKSDKNIILNNFILHKVLPKLMFDGEKAVGDVAKKDILISFREYINEKLEILAQNDNIDYCVDDLDRVINNAKANDWVVNYWAK